MVTEQIINSFTNMNVRIYSHDVNVKGSLCPLHCHREFEFLYMPKGSLRCEAGGESIEIRQGEVLFLNSYTPHQTFYLEDNSFCIFVQFDENDFTSNLAVQTRKHIARFVKLEAKDAFLIKNDHPDHDAITSYITAIHDASVNKDKAYETYIKGYLYMILGFLYKNDIVPTPESCLDSEALFQIMPSLVFIGDNYKSKLTLNEISNSAMLSPTYFCRLFKKALNTTPINYLNFVRICNATVELFSTNRSVLDIALDSGFSSISYFNKTFKSIIGITPGEYRRIKHAKI